MKIKLTKYKALRYDAFCALGFNWMTANALVYLDIQRANECAKHFNEWR